MITVISTGSKGNFYILEAGEEILQDNIAIMNEAFGAANCSFFGLPEPYGYGCSDSVSGIYADVSSRGMQLEAYDYNQGCGCIGGFCSCADNTGN